MESSVRPLGSEDMPLVIDLSRRIWPVAYAGVLTPVEIENILAHIYSEENLAAELAAGHRFWAAEESGAALGYASGYRADDTVWLKKLYVLPQAQGQGIGRRLLETVAAAFLPAREIRLLVNSGNAAAQGFYERCGFSRAAVVPVRMGDYDFTDYVYARSIAPDLP